MVLLISFLAFLIIFGPFCLYGLFSILVSFGLFWSFWCFLVFYKHPSFVFIMRPILKVTIYTYLEMDVDLKLKQDLYPNFMQVINLIILIVK